MKIKLRTLYIEKNNICIHGVDEEDFNNLKNIYPYGEYDRLGITKWFSIEKEELSITFFLN